MKEKLKAAWIFVKTVGTGLLKVLLIGFCAVKLFQKIQDYLKWIDDKDKM